MPSPSRNRCPAEGDGSFLFFDTYLTRKSSPHMAYRVLPVPGRMLLHPGSIGAAQQHMIGHRRWVTDLPYEKAPHLYRPNPFTGELYAITQHAQVDAVVLVPEYEGYYMYRAIMDGDLDYVETVMRPGTPDEVVTVDASLVKVTARHRAARGETRSVAQHLVDLAKADPPAAPAADPAPTPPTPPLASDSPAPAGKPAAPKTLKKD